MVEAADQLIQAWPEQVAVLLVMQALMAQLVQTYEVGPVVKTLEVVPGATVGQHPQLLSTAAQVL